MTKLKLVALTIVALFAIEAVAQQIPQRPNPPRLVNDFASLMSKRQQVALEDSLAAFARRTSTQIVVVTVNSFDGTDAADFAYKIGEAWGVGQKEKNNGAVILVKPKTQQERGQAFIASGYGLEGVLPDVMCSRIVNNIMIPHFKNNDYAAGIISGAIVTMQTVDGEYTADKVESKDGSFVPFIVILFIVVVVVASLKGKGGGSGGGHISSSSGLDALLLASMLGSSRSRSNWGSFSGGSGSFGGGGFGGFGGGSFGGGGGGGSW